MTQPSFENIIALQVNICLKKYVKVLFKYLVSLVFLSFLINILLERFRNY